MKYFMKIIVLGTVVFSDLALFNRLSNGLQQRITSSQRLENSDLTGPAAIEVQILSNLLLKNRLDTTKVVGRFRRIFKNGKITPRYRNYKHNMMKMIRD